MGGTTTRENPRQTRTLSRPHDRERDRASLLRSTVGRTVVFGELLGIKIKIELILNNTERKYNKHAGGQLRLLLYTEID